MTLLPLYIDPGTGSMLFSLFIGIAAAASFGLRALFLKIKFIFSAKQSLKADNNNSLYPPPYDTQNSTPYVIFSDHKRYWNVFKPVCDEFERRQIPLIYYTASPDDPALSAGYQFVRTEFIGEGNKPYAKLNMLRADILLATTPGLDVYQWKRSKGVKCYVHIPHTVDDLAGYRMFGLDFYDAVLVSGDNQKSLIKKIEELRPNIRRKEIITAGSTYLDQMQERLDSLPPREQNERTVVLIAPSWGASGILARYGERLLSALQKEKDFDIIVRPHPQTVVSEKDILEPLQAKFPDIEWNFDNDNFDVLRKSDILITDFSGIMFDYTFIFDKPLIYADTDFDSMPYDADWIDEPMWALRILPELGVRLEEKDFPSIAQVIKTALNSETLEQSRQRIKDEAWQNRGSSAKSVVDYLVEKREQIKKP